MKKLAGLLIFALLTGFLTLTPSVPRALACNAEDFGGVVDQTARALRELNADGAKRYNAKLREYREKYNLTQDELRARAAALEDERMSEFNREIEALVNDMDILSRTPSDRITCQKLDELTQVRDRLLTVMGQKSGYMLANVDAAFSQPPASGTQVQRQAKADQAPSQETAPAETEATAPVASAPTGAEQPSPQLDAAAGDEAENQLAASAPPANADPAVEPPVADPGLPERRPAQTGQTAEAAEIQPDPAAEQTVALIAPDSQDQAAWETAPVDVTPEEPAFDTGPAAAEEDLTFSIAEIRNVGRGIFGTLTAEFAGAVNYAFQQFGRPNAYITGSEGGAALLAGLRYGKGTLHTKREEPSTIYWQGPSLGYDVGAEGSNTLFLVYNLKKVERIYGRFTGVGGSAYVAGGLGVNVLGKGGMVMVPIRTGIGLRIGANLAYLKFTERQTWNPF